jgi:hypothetical protein
MMAYSSQMFTTPIIFTAVISTIGFILNCGMLYLVLARGRKRYHYLFAAVLLICAIWDFGILMSMLRNSYENELIIYGYIVFLPCSFLMALIYQFTTTYLEKPKRIPTILLWVFCAWAFISIATQLAGKIDGVYHYSWGNIYRPDRRLQMSSLLFIPASIFAYVGSSWMLLKESKKTASGLARRHMKYIAVSFIVLTFASVKLGVLFGIDNPVLLPAGMLVNDVFSAIIAVAIVKHHLFDITFIIKKGAIYSALAGILIFVFSFSEHILITYMGDLIGGHSQWIHFVSIGVGILVMMPIKHRIERAVERFFAERTVEF